MLCCMKSMLSIHVRDYLPKFSPNILRYWVSIVIKDRAILTNKKVNTIKKSIH